MKRLKLKKEVNGVFLPEETGKLLYFQEPFSVQEAYRTTRTNLMFLPQQTEGSCRKIAFTSPGAGEGKSLNCANLAIALAQDGKRVLLLDCDMRNSTQHRLMRCAQSPGLSEYLAGMEKQLTVHENQRIKGLTMVMAGSTPPNPTELLNTPAMGNLLRSLSASYDYIMLDTTPLNLVADALVLKELVDGFVMVIRADRTNRNEVDLSLEKLRQVDAHIFGFLLSDENPKSGKYGKYKRCGKYGKYGYIHEKQF
ncbi:MAG: CpsD/CapB family tyrosine-protein kinase [Oscillospiraceae bacterium]|nr:CpsD/CapB family tyrosine-protein kinase [Oscillospiraceae bacterium]